MAVANGTYTRTNSFGKSEDGVFPRFYIDTVLNPFATQQAGREVWEEIEMVEMLMPGNMLTRPTSKVSDEHRNRWPEAYAAFKRGEEMSVEGRPLEEWPMLSRAQVKELKYLDFYTVEQVADMTELAIQRIGMGARQLKTAAQAFIGSIDATLPLRSLSIENEKLKQQVEAQAHQLAQQGAMLEQLNGRFLELMNQPHPVATAVPGMLDPAQAGGYRGGAQGAAAPAASSSLARLAKRKPTTLREITAAGANDGNAIGAPAPATAPTPATAKPKRSTRAKAVA